MYKFITSYTAALVTLLVLDGVWIGFIAKDFYKQHIGFLFRETPIWPAVIAFYILYAAAIMFFVVTPTAGSIPKAALWGALLGLTAYMTYDLVNYGTVQNFPFIVAIADIAWGIIISTVAGIIAALVFRA